MSRNKIRETFNLINTNIIAQEKNKRTNLNGKPFFGNIVQNTYTFDNYKGRII